MEHRDTVILKKVLSELRVAPVSYTHLDVYKRQPLSGVVLQTLVDGRAVILVHFAALQGLSLIHI